MHKQYTLEKILSKKWDILLIGTLFILLYILGIFLPVGHDWGHFFSRGVIPSIWVPWTDIIVRFLTLPLVFAITVITIGFRAFQHDRSPFVIVLALLSLPTLWVLFVGNIDGVVLLGLLMLPIGAPLVLLKPQVASFALLARWSSLIFASIWLLISFWIWGLWPLRFLVVLTNDWATEWVQDISLFPWGLIVALPLMWFSREDEDLLMAAGSLGTPHLFPYHYIVLMPALARMQWRWRIITWLVSWTPLLAEWFGNWAWHFGNVLSICFWLGIYFGKKDLVEKQP